MLATFLVTSWQPAGSEAQTAQLLGLALLPGLILATLFKREHLFAAPVGFVVGFAVQFLPWIVSVPGLVFAVAISLASESIGAFFFSLSVAVLALGRLHSLDVATIGVGTVVAACPILVSALKKGELGLAMRRQRRAAGAARDADPAPAP